jgi:hypothetical protein
LRLKPNPGVRANAAGALSRIGEEARPAESALRDALKKVSIQDTDTSVRTVSSITCKQLGGK